MKMKIADALLIVMQKNMMLFKDLSKNNVHFSVFIIGSMIDCHVTLEPKGSVKKKHVQLFKLQFDWRFLIERMIQDVLANWNSIFQRVKINDPEWQNLEVEFIPIQLLIELLSPIQRRHRWNVDVDFLDKFEKSIQHVKLKELANYGLIIGTSPEGYLILSNGADCWLLDQNSLSKKMEKNLELSIRNIHLKYYTLRLVILCIKIRLLNLNRIAVTYLRKKID